MVSQIAKAVSGSTAKIKQAKFVPPAQEPATPMPDLDAEKRAAKAEELMRHKTGRNSTLLTDDEDKL